MLLHGFLVAPLVMSGNLEKRDEPPDPLQTSVVTHEESEEFASTLIFFEFPAAIEVSSAEPEPLPNSAQAADSLVVLPALVQLTFEDDAAAPEVESPEEDSAALALQYGKYTGQVAARIEGAWIRPTSLHESTPFVCQVRIEQDRDGHVLTVELLKCDDDSQWQLSLVAAIDRASPLSAPPSPSVFSSQLILNFSSSALPAPPSVLAGRQ
jgi:hypothetical protein